MVIMFLSVLFLLLTHLLQMLFPATVLVSGSNPVPVSLTVSVSVSVFVSVSGVPVPVFPQCVPVTVLDFQPPPLSW